MTEGHGTTGPQRESRPLIVTEPIHVAGMQILRAAAQVQVLESPSFLSLVAAVRDADALIVKFARVTREVLAGAKRLQVVAKHGVGTDNIDLEAAHRLGIQILNVPAMNSNAVAEFVIALGLSLARGVHRAHQVLVAGQEVVRDTFLGTELAGKVAGLIGFGHVGQAVARKALGLGMRVLAYDPYISGRLGQGLEDVQRVELEPLFRQADLVSIQCPLTPETRHLVGSRQLAWLKPTAILVNAARADVVDLVSAVEALRTGRLQGVAIDAAPEVLQTLAGALQLQAEGRLLLTPHIAAMTREAQERIAIEVCEDVVGVLAGRSPRHPVHRPVVPAPRNPEVPVTHT